MRLVANAGFEDVATTINTDFNIRDPRRVRRRMYLNLVCFRGFSNVNELECKLVHHVAVILDTYVAYDVVDENRNVNGTIEYIATIISVKTH